MAKMTQEEWDDWHKINGVLKCGNCGKSLMGQEHHYYCNDCHIQKKPKYTLGQMITGIQYSY